MKQIAVAFTGVSGSGKTTLIEKISTRLSSNYRVVVVKHDPKEKAQFDTPGKDSDRFFKSGADTMVVSPKRTTLLKHTTSNLEGIQQLAGAYDYLFIEGLKTFPLKRVGVFRQEVQESYFDCIDLIASKDVDPSLLPKGLQTVDLDDIDTIIEWIDKHGTS